MRLGVIGGTGLVNLDLRHELGGDGAALDLVVKDVFAGLGRLEEACHTTVLTRTTGLLLVGVVELGAS